MKKYKYIFISLLIIILDQLSKYLINNNFILNKEYPLINNFFYMTNAHNTGAAFSILSGYNILLLIITILTIYILMKNVNKNISFYILLGGIIGNFIDRIFLGYVRDFLDFRIFNYNFPIFNISDICICIGIFLMIIEIVKEDKNASRWK